MSHANFSQFVLSRKRLTTAVAAILLSLFQSINCQTFTIDDSFNRLYENSMIAAANIHFAYESSSKMKLTQTLSKQPNNNTGIDFPISQTYSPISNSLTFSNNMQITSKETGIFIGKFFLGALCGAAVTGIAILATEGRRTVPSDPNSPVEHVEHPGYWLVGGALIGGIVLVIVW